MTRSVTLGLFCIFGLTAGEVWRLNPQAAITTNPALLAVLPDVHSVGRDTTYLYVESAGLSLHPLGPSQANGLDSGGGVRKFVFRFPLHPEKNDGESIPTPFGVTGAFLNGVPIYNSTSASSYNDQNLWHFDATTGELPAPNGNPPLIGFALDGYPIFGAKYRSSYRLRQITKRTQLPDGTLLQPSQEGPPAGGEFPLGTFVEDYQYVAGSGDLDEHNGRVGPDGSYAYFLSGYPHLIGPTYYGKFEIPVATSVVHEPDTGPISLSVEGETLRFVIRGDHGQRVRYLEKVHERPIHLVVVSNDLKEFAHIHPELQPDDSFAVTYKFPHSGEFWLYADYTPPGQPNFISTFRLDVPEGSGPFYKTNPIPNSAEVTMLPLPIIRTGEDVKFSFQVSATDLEPYLGAWAHMMIVSEDKRHFIHAHPLDAVPGIHTHALPGPSPSTISTITGFKDPGTYRMWVQVQRHGDVMTFPFSFRVQTGARKTKAPVIKDAIHVTVSRKGFEPSRINAPAGEPLRIAFDRTDAENCASSVVFPELGISRDLPAGKTLVVELPASTARELSFACGMGMYRGSLIIK